jgi:hypothetical protein
MEKRPGPRAWLNYHSSNQFRRVIWAMLALCPVPVIFLSFRFTRSSNYRIQFHQYEAPLPQFYNLTHHEVEKQREPPPVLNAASATIPRAAASPTSAATTASPTAAPASVSPPSLPVIDVSAIQKRLANLSCGAFGGPDEAQAKEMVYWQDIPSDTAYQSPFRKRMMQGANSSSIKTKWPRKYMVRFTPLTRWRDLSLLRSYRPFLDCATDI